MERIRSIVIAGGDTIAPMVAAAIANSLQGQDVRITLIDEAAENAGAHSSMPQAAEFHGHLGLDYRELLRRTNATFKLGCDYTAWSKPGHNFLQAYGGLGASLRLVPFHHYLVKQGLARDASALSDYSLAATAAKMSRFALPSSDPNSIMSTFGYGLHVDAAQYAAVFRDHAIRLGVVMVDDATVGARRRESDGFIESVHLAKGAGIEGDLFIDCTGSRGLLISGALEQGYIDWSRYLPCDRSLTLSVADLHDLPPLTFVVAKRTGWSRRIPMRGRSDYGFFYSSRFIDDDEAEASMRRDIGRKTVGSCRKERFVSGRRERFWHKNCVAIGRAAGFVEPLEASNLHLAQNAVLRLVGLFPDRACDPLVADEFNRLLGREYDNIRDFVALFYASTQRGNSAFWMHARALDVPESLAGRIALFASRGRLSWNEPDVFTKEYWVSALLGLGHVPAGYDPLADVPDDERIKAWMDTIRGSIREAARHMPLHNVFIDNSLAV